MLTTFIQPPVKLVRKNSVSGTVEAKLLMADVVVKKDVLTIKVINVSHVLLKDL